MLYLTYQEFAAYPMGIEVSESEYGTLCFYACEIIDRITFGRIPQDADPPSEVKKAVAYQIAYMAQNGGADLILNAGDANSESIGSYSYSSGGQKSRAVCPMSRAVLFPTGLLYAGIGGHI